MTVKSIEIQFVQCDSCGAHAPAVFDNDHSPRTDGQLAQDAAREQGWRVNGDGADICEACIPADDAARAEGGRRCPTCKQ